jgi:hypothetical protein
MESFTFAKHSTVSKLSRHSFYFITWCSRDGIGEEPQGNKRYLVAATDFVLFAFLQTSSLFFDNQPCYRKTSLSQ